MTVQGFTDQGSTTADTLLAGEFPRVSELATITGGSYKRGTVLYNKNGYEKALAKIDKMDTEDVKSYIKKLIKDDMILGIQIIKNSH